MTVKHWNTGPAAARFRIQAASVKLKKNLAGADSPKKTQSALANSGRKHQVTSYKLPGPKPISNANKGLIHRRQASSRRDNITEKQLIAFKDGVANALLDGNVNEDVKDKFCRSSYQQGYDFGLTMYCRYNKLDKG